METSAKDNLNVKEVFQELLRMETRQNMTLVGDSSDSKGLLSCFRFLRHNSARGGKSPTSAGHKAPAVSATSGPNS